MRILLTTDTIGGVWVFTKELAVGLLDRGHPVALVSLGRLPSPDQQHACSSLAQSYGSAFRFEALNTPLEWMQNNEQAYTQAEPALLRIASTFQPDILHLNQFCFGSLPLQIPKLITAHSDVLSWGEACKPAGLEPSAWLDRYIALVQQGLASADALAAPTAWMLSALQRNFSTPAKTHVIPNGRTAAKISQTQERKLQAVSVGRLWDEAKNLSLLSSIESPIPILVAGEQAHESISARTALGQIQPLGPLAEHDLLTLFTNSSLYIAGSLYEPFGLAPLEAALCGCAILANDIPSLREVWGGAALYFRTAEDLVQILHQLAASSEALTAARFSSQSRAREFTRERMTEAYESLYNDLLCSDSTGPQPKLATHVC